MGWQRLLDAPKYRLTSEAERDAASLLDVKISEIDEFIQGFDGTFASKKLMYFLGQQLRQRLLNPETKSP